VSGRNFGDLRSFPYRDCATLYDVRVEAVRMICVLHARRDNDHLDFG
jgi:hypothetical protein